MSKTQDNLKAAFAGESQANRKYLAFAKAAEAEGKPGVARLFRVAAEGETVHALNHFRTLGEVRTTAENLKAAIAGETHEFETMYPQFIKEAQEEGEKGAEISFNSANEVEKIHQQMYSAALARIEAGEDVDLAEYKVCEICGNVFVGEIPENCPICKAPREKFKQVL
jgi:rubrerythrin